jgi:hypothetical protein
MKTQDLLSEAAPSLSCLPLDISPRVYSLGLGIFSTSSDHMRKRIFSTASDVRIWAEEYALKNHFRTDLCGLCAKASAELYRKYTEVGISCVIHSAKYYNSGHFFNVVANEWLVDITASQFGQSNITIIGKWPLPSIYDECWWWKSNTQFQNIKVALLHQMENKWPKHQLIDLRDNERNSI